MPHKAFSLVEAIVTMLIMSIIVLASMPVMTKLATTKAGLDKNSLSCIQDSTAINSLYNSSNGTTTLPSEGTACYGSVTGCRYDQGKACDTLIWQAENGTTTTNKTAAKKILRAACDQGGETACDWFIKQCLQNPGSSPNYCDNTNDFMDITYYLNLADNDSTNIGRLYMTDELTKLIERGITKISDEVNKDCLNSLSSTSCTLPTPSNLIISCNSGSADACKLAYNYNYNRSCNQVKTSWLESPTGNYKLTPNGSTSPVTTNCDMTSLITASVSGCNALNSGDCSYAYNNNYNRSCNQLKSVWSNASTKNYYLTPNGYSSPVNTYCDMTNFATASITGCNYSNSGDCSYAYNNSYNRGCNQVKSSWSAAPSGTYRLTPNGSGSPVSTSCTLSSYASAAITGCNAGNSNDCSYGYNNNYNRTCMQINNTYTSGSGTYSITLFEGPSSYRQVSCSAGYMSSPILLGNWGYSGGQQTWTIPSNYPSGQPYRIEIWGADGGIGSWSYYNGYSGYHNGGYGGHVYGDINLSPGALLYIFIGGGGGTKYNLKSSK